MLPAIAARLVPAVRCWMNARNRAALVISLRCLVSEAPQILHRHRVVPLLVVPFRFISPPQWQRGRFFGIGQPNHRSVAHHGSHTGDFRKRGPIYAFGAYIFRKRGVQSMKINDSGHTFCRLTPQRGAGRRSIKETPQHFSSLEALGRSHLRGIVAFYFPSVRLCAGGSALRTPKTIPPYSAPATGTRITLKKKSPLTRGKSSMFSAISTTTGSSLLTQGKGTSHKVH